MSQLNCFTEICAYIAVYQCIKGIFDRSLIVKYTENRRTAAAHKRASCSAGDKNILDFRNTGMLICYNAFKLIIKSRANARKILIYYGVGH